MHRTVSWHRHRVFVHAVAADHFINVRGGGCRYERALFSAQRAAGVDAVSAAARAMDGQREAIYGISAARYAGVPDLRTRRPTRTRGRDLGELLFVDRLRRVLDERGVHRAGVISSETNDVDGNHARASARQRRLFNRGQISRGYSRPRANSAGRLATVYA